MTIAAKIKTPLSTRGEAVLAELDRLGFKSLSAVERKADLDAITIRRVIFTGGSLKLLTFDKLRAIGVSEAALRTV